ncbi:uncharacterized protein AKAW2_80712A [Aspergillus luchuensis]|uniref:Uncharacterized protein n=1 Tax=Aspergillus kawachii TaxID=1069201 RepID=A0A7R7WL59_ASPKA|nr:uncharacterized protein AKAW2_80712A [Aspergillus luchuensis]BCS04911.1 hypothetical protein AKAW2_80712A [Aspergillus luchuensis]
MKSASAFPKLSGDTKGKDILIENTVLSDYFPQLWDSVIAKQYGCAQKPSDFTLYEPQPGELTEHRSDRDFEKKDVKSIHLPFGDGGTTVSLTYRGECMQISRYLGCGQSSIFSIEHESLPVPFLASRRNKTFTHMQRIGYGFGLGLEVPTQNHDLRIQWLRSRWPRLTSEAEGWKLEQQWAVKEGVVIAHSRLHNKSNCNSISTSLAKDLGFRIRELDFVSRDCPFNDDDNDDQRYAEGAGPGGYGFVKIHEFASKGLWAYRHKARRTEANDAEQPRQPDGVTAVVGFFVNGEPWTIDRIETEDIQIKPKGYTDLVVGYRLALISKQADNRALLTLTAKDLDVNEYFRRTIGEGTTDSETAYEMLAWAISDGYS